MSKVSKRRQSAFVEGFFFGSADLFFGLEPVIELRAGFDERLRLHQERSGPVMDQLHRWLEAQFAERKTEPNSGLGKAITYLLRHWRPLTLFLRIAGAPVDNNIVERP
jgi:hypothetical protein